MSQLIESYILKQIRYYFQDRHFGVHHTRSHRRREAVRYLCGKLRAIRS